MTFTINIKTVLVITAYILAVVTVLSAVGWCAKRDDEHNRITAYPATVYCPSAPPVNVDSVFRKSYEQNQLVVVTRNGNRTFSTTCNVLHRSQ